MKAYWLEGWKAEQITEDALLALSGSKYYPLEIPNVIIKESVNKIYA